ncbi:MAG: hypothetical protein IKF64_06260 [Eubacterium sp.]|nr:hypothetical protein [Eubacterium sp.]
MKKKLSISIICTFLAVVVFFTSFSVFGKKSDFSVDENRALMTMPDISLDTILDGSFQKDYEEYLSDQFEWRSFFVTVKTDIMRALGRKDLNGVYFGKDGYLIEKYLPADFSSDDISYNEDMLSDFLLYLNDKGINTVCAFVPSKASVLDTVLPKNAVPYDTEYVADETLELAQGVKSADLYGALRAHNDEYIYYKTDHHWTNLGAYYGYQALAEPLVYTPVTLDGIAKKDVSTDFFGSTFDKVQVKAQPDTITVYDTGVKVNVNYNGEADNANTLYNEEMLGEKSKYDYFLGGNYARVDITTDCGSGKTLLMFKDSYANSMIPFLCCNYSKIIMVDLRYFSDDVYALIDKETGIDDALVLYNTEKFMKDQNQNALEMPEK